MPALRAAVIGVGYLGKFHAQKYAALPDVELVAVADENRTRAEEVARTLGCRAAVDVQGLLGAIDLASIVVPTEHHYSVARTCLEAGVHVLVEKPVTRTLAEADDLIRLAAAKNCIFQVGHVERFNPAVIAAQRVPQVPLALAALDWREHGPHAYRVTWVPQDPYELEVERPTGLHVIARSRARVLVARLAAMLQGRLAGTLVDDGGFVVRDLDLDERLTPTATPTTQFWV